MGLRYQHFEQIEKNAVLLAILIAFMVSLGGLSEITPLFANANSVKPAPGVTPYDPLRLAGKDIYVRDGCYLCHSQMIRAQHFETQRYGPHSVAGESVYDRPFQWGSKRTGPDLARVGGRYSDDWHRVHLVDPRAVVPESNMPAFPWLGENAVDGAQVTVSMQALQHLGDPYSDEQIQQAASDVRGKTELDAVVAYLQGLGRHAPRGAAAASGMADTATAAAANESGEG